MIMIYYGRRFCKELNIVGEDRFPTSIGEIKVEYRKEKKSLDSDRRHDNCVYHDGYGVACEDNQT